MRRICKWRGCVLTALPCRDCCPAHEKARKHHGHIVKDSPFQGLMLPVCPPVTIQFKVLGELVSFTAH